MPTEEPFPTDEDLHEIVTVAKCDPEAPFDEDLYEVVTVTCDVIDALDEDLYEIVTVEAPSGVGDCICCECVFCMCRGFWSAWTFTLSGIGPTGSLCDPRLNKTFTLNWLGGCEWGVDTRVNPGKIFNDGTKWVLTIENAGFSSYEASYEDFSCQCGGTFTLVGTASCTGFPATIDVTPAGTWTVCGMDEPPCEESFGAVAAVAAPPTLPKRKPLALVCTHRGDRLTDDEKADRDLYQLREWVWCAHPEKPLGEAVCGCRGCGPRCRGYEAPLASCATALR